MHIGQAAFQPRARKIPPAAGKPAAAWASNGVVPSNVDASDPQVKAGDTTGGENDRALIARVAARDEEAFERLVIRAEELARDNLAVEPDEGEFLELDPYDREDFDTLVREALDDLPDLLIKALDRVPVVVSDKGRQAGAYGLYQGDTVARDNYHDRIIIFRDTLLRDFGHDPDLLRDQVTRTVRHELAHHLGADELGVRELGL